eukprot:387228-Rhodomonas_salina.1
MASSCRAAWTMTKAGTRAARACFAPSSARLPVWNRSIRIANTLSERSLKTRSMHVRGARFAGSGGEARRQESRPVGSRSQSPKCVSTTPDSMSRSPKAWPSSCAAAKTLLQVRFNAERASHALGPCTVGVDVDVDVADAQSPTTATMTVTCAA